MFKERKLSYNLKQHNLDSCPIQYEVKKCGNNGVET